MFGSARSQAGCGDGKVQGHPSPPVWRTELLRLCSVRFKGTSVANSWQNITTKEEERKTIKTSLHGTAKYNASKMFHCI
jgi:hypothetical protein